LHAGYKIYAKILNMRLSSIAERKLSEEQCGFRKGRSCTDGIFTTKLIIEKRREYNLPTYLLFIDYEKAFDRVDRNKLWTILNNKGCPQHLINIIKVLYNNSNFCLHIEGKIQIRR
jgi:sorting nexin-29